MSTLDPSLLEALKKSLDPPIKAFYDAFIGATTSTVQIVFRFTIPIAFIAFALSWLLPELELRKTVQTVDSSEGFGSPQNQPVARGDPAGPWSASRPAREFGKETLSHAWSHPGRDRPAAPVLLVAVPAGRSTGRHQARDGAASVEGSSIFPGIIQPGVDCLVTAGMVEEVTHGGRSGDLVLTPALGLNAIDRLLTEARRSGLTELLG